MSIALRKHISNSRWFINPTILTFAVVRYLLVWIWHKIKLVYSLCSIESRCHSSPVWVSLTKTTCRMGALKTFTPSTTNVREYKAPPVTLACDCDLDENVSAPGYDLVANVLAAQ